MQLLPLGGTTRLPPLAALGWIIAYYVEFGKIRGTESPLRLRRCPPFHKGGCCSAPLGPLVKGGWHRRKAMTGGFLRKGWESLHQNG